MFAKLKVKLSSYFRDAGSLIFTVILILLFWIGWPLGIYHSFKKHSRLDNFASFLIPWGIYRGIESVFHEDPSNHAKLKEMRISMVVLLNNINSVSNQNYSKSANFVKLSLNKINQNELDSLKQFSRDYIIALHSVLDDVSSYLINSVETHGNNSFNFSNKSVLLIAKTKGLGADEVIGNINSNIKSSIEVFFKSNLGDNYLNVETAELDKFLNNYISTIKDQSKDSYKFIFSENFN